MADYTLTCFAQSGNAYKAALYCELAGVDWEAKWINFFDGEHRAADYLAKNEYGQVPILETADGRCYSQSGLILNVLEREVGRFGGATQAEKDEIERWILWDNYGFTSIIAPYRFIANFVPEEKRSADVLGFLGGRLKTALKVLDRRLEGREFVATEGLSIADLSLIGYLYYGEELPFDLSEHANVTAWLERIKALPGWKGPYELMPNGPAA